MTALPAYDPYEPHFTLAACGHTCDPALTTAGCCEDCWMALHPDEDAEIADAWAEGFGVET